MQRGGPAPRGGAPTNVNPRANAAIPLGPSSAGTGSSSVPEFPTGIQNVTTCEFAWTVHGIARMIERARGPDSDGGANCSLEDRSVRSGAWGNGTWEAQVGCFR